MIHDMNLNSVPYYKIRNKTKTIELRLNDEKRRQIQPGDFIIFTNNENGEQITARVINLYHFHSFSALYQALPLNRCGYTDEEMKTASADDMLAYYTEKQQKFWGVVGIELRLC